MPTIYQPFPIYDLRSGLQLDREPWMLPENAFSQLEDAYCKDGRIWKRKGFERFAIGANGGVNVLAAPPVMGLYNYYKSDGSSALIALDTDFLYEYNSTNDDWVGKGGYPGTPDFTGDGTQFFWCENWKDLFFITNNKDYIQIWNGSALSDLRPSLGGADYLDGCLLLIANRGRLIALNTLETGTRYPQRARCSTVGTYDTWDDDIYVDADTVDWITGVSLLRNEVIVMFERSVKWLRYTGDAAAPFTWVNIADTDGIYAPWSVTNFEDEVLGLGPTTIMGTDGLKTYSITEKLPDLVLQMNQQKTHLAYGCVAEELTHYFCTYPSSGETYCDKILALNYLDNCFALFNMPVHTFGYYQQASDWTFDDVTCTMDEMDWAFDEKTLTAGYPLVLFGDTSGYVNKFLNGNSDNGSNIASIVKTKRLVPFPTQKAKLGYIDIIGDSGSVLNVDVKVYKGYDSIPYISDSINLYEAGKDKVRKRIRVMTKGEHFVVELSDNTTANPYAIDAIIPYFKAAGSI